MTDIIGNKYGRLTVIKFDHYNKFNNPYWLCECECGNKKSIRESSLKNGWDFIKALTTPYKKYKTKELKQDD